MGRLVKSLHRHGGTRGTAGIEFALIAGFLSALLVGLVDVGVILSERRDMQSAIRTASTYFMVGGTDLTEAAAVLAASWESRPDNTTVSIVKQCYCGGTAAVCTANCPDGALPEAFHIIQVTATFDGLIIDTEHGFEEMVRIR